MCCRDSSRAGLLFLMMLAGFCLLPFSGSAQAQDAEQPLADTGEADVIDPNVVPATALPKETRLIGSARTGRRRWVTGATVLALPENGDPRVYVTSTDEQGVFRFDAVPEGEYDVTVVKQGLSQIHKDNVLLDFPFRAVVEVLMELGDTGPLMSRHATGSPNHPTVDDGSEFARLKGRVLDRDGAGAGEVRVRLVRVDGTVDPRDLISDGEGRFDTGELAQGIWRVEVLGAGFLPMRVIAQLTRTTEVLAVLVPQPAQYEPQPIDLMPPEEPIAPPPPETHEPAATS